MVIIMKIKDGFILKEIVADYIVVPVGNNLVDFKLMITLNDTGAFLWNSLGEDKTFDELVAALLSEYDIDEETAKADVAEFLELLKDKKVLDE